MEVEMAGCFGELSDVLTDAKKRGRARDSAQNQLEIAEVAVIHATEKRRDPVVRQAREQLGTALLRCGALTTKIDDVKPMLKDATDALERAVKDDSDNIHPDATDATIGRLAECFLARAASADDVASNLERAHTTIDLLQKRLSDDDDDEKLARISVALAHTLAAQLDLTKDPAARTKYAGRVFEQLTKVVDDDEVSLSLLEARTHYLSSSSAKDEVEALDAAIAAFDKAKVNADDDKSVPLGREIARAVAYLMMKKATLKSPSPNKDEEEDSSVSDLKRKALTTLEDVDKVYTDREAQKNPDAACACALDLARACSDNDRIRILVARSLRFACDIAARTLYEGSTFDAVEKAIDNASDLGVDAVSGSLRTAYADDLKKSGAWFWLAPTTRRAIPLEGFELVRFAEAKRSVRRLAHLAPVLRSRLARRPALEAMFQPSSETPGLMLGERRRRLAPRPLPMIRPTPTKAGNLSELLATIPTLLRVPATTVQADPDRSIATQKSSEMAAMLEQQQNDDDNDDGLLYSLIGASLRVTEYSDLLQFPRDEAVVSWSVHNGSLVAVAFYGAQLKALNDVAKEGSLPCGIFVCPWDDKRLSDLRSLASRISDNDALSDLGKKLGIDALVQGLPVEITKLALVLADGMEGLPIHVLPAVRQSDDPQPLGELFEVRYASSVATLLALEKRRSESGPRPPARYGASLGRIQPRFKLVDAAFRTGWTSGGGSPVVDVMDDDNLLKRADGVVLHLDPAESHGQTTTNLAARRFGGPASVVVLPCRATMDVIDVLLASGAGAVVAPVWDPPKPNDDNGRGALFLALALLIFWRTYVRDPDRKITTALRESSLWLRHATLQEARRTVADACDDATLFQKAFRDVYGPEAGNLGTTTLSRGISSYGLGGALGCFGHCGGPLKTLIKKKQLPSILSSLAAPVVRRLSGDKSTTEVPRRRRSSDSTIRSASTGDGETMLTSRTDLSDDDDEIDPEARAWIAYCETPEGRDQLEKLGLDRALRAWTLERRKMWAALAAKEALKKSKDGARFMAQSAIQAREKFRDSGGDDAVLRARDQAVEQAQLFATFTREKFREKGGDAALERAQFHFLRFARSIRDKYRQVLDSNVAHRLTNVAGATYQKIERSNAMAYSRRIATKTERGAFVLRTKFRDLGGDAAIDRARRTIVHRTRAAVQASRDRVAHLVAPGKDDDSDLGGVPESKSTAGDD